MVARRDDWISVEDFLALDRESFDQKYEYRNGRMVAMAGGSTNHSLIILNTCVLIETHLANSPCATFPEMTLRIDDTCLIPDVMVTCNEKDLEKSKTFIEHPSLVIEVLSPSTERDDRGEKFLHYINCPTIQEYVLISQDLILVQTLTRKVLEWIYRGFTCDEDVELQSIGLTVPIEKFYKRVVLPPLKPLLRRV